MSGLGGLAIAWLTQRPPALRVAAWTLAVAGPALLTLAALALDSTFFQGGFLLSALILVIALAVLGGIRPALTALVLASLARMIFFGPPFASRTADMTPTMVSLTGFVVAGAAVSLLVAKVDQLAVEQAALRRVATQVAQSMPTGELFALTALEAGRLVGADYVRIGRYESDDLVGVATWDRTAERRRDSAVGRLVRAHGARQAAAVPVMVGERLWGLMLTGSTMRWTRRRRTERRVAGFAALLGAAISNAESRVGLTSLADQQAALRRVATLVAREAPPESVFTAVTEEAGHLFRPRSQKCSAMRLTARRPSSLAGEEAPSPACQSATGNRSAGEILPP